MLNKNAKRERGQMTILQIKNCLNYIMIYKLRAKVKVQIVHLGLLGIIEQKIMSAICLLHIACIKLQVLMK